MRHYPHIKHINEVLHAVGEDFIVVDRDDYKVINYVVVKPETFPPLNSEVAYLRREFRGITFNKEGNIISRPYHKFFNIGEREETLSENISIDSTHSLVQKLDGSMIHPIPIGKGYRLATRMGVTDIAMQAENFIANHSAYDNFIKYAIAVHITPIFEWCSNKQQIILPHEDDRLILTGLRNNHMGYYYDLNNIGKTWHIETVPNFNGTFLNVSDLAASIKSLTNQEGIVLQSNGELYKCKTDWYVLRHHSKDSITREKNIISFLVNNQLDDLISHLTKYDSEQIKQFEELFWHGFNKTVVNLQAQYEFNRSIYSTRKNFALTTVFDNPQIKTIMFKLWDNCDLKKTLLKIIQNSVGSQSEIDKVRWIWHNHVWNYKGEPLDG